MYILTTLVDALPCAGRNLRVSYRNTPTKVSDADYFSSLVRSGCSPAVGPGKKPAWRRLLRRVHPYERLENDVKMMNESGINVVRIAELTGSTVNLRIIHSTSRTSTGYSLFYSAVKAFNAFSFWGAKNAANKVLALAPWGVKTVAESR